jgi:hypothetical protein
MSSSTITTIVDPNFPNITIIDCPYGIDIDKLDKLEPGFAYRWYCYDVPNHPDKIKERSERLMQEHREANAHLQQYQLGLDTNYIPDKCIPKELRDALQALVDDDFYCKYETDFLALASPVWKEKKDVEVIAQMMRKHPYGAAMAVEYFHWFKMSQMTEKTYHQHVIEHIQEELIPLMEED